MKTDPSATPLSDETARALADAVKGFTDKLEDTEQAIRRNRTWNVITGAVLVAVLVVGAFVWNLTERVDNTVSTVKSVQCSLYGLFLGSYNPDSSAAREDPEAYERAFARIRADNARLDCPKAIVAPAPKENP